jgi:hypothetical protein
MEELTANLAVLQRSLGKLLVVHSNLPKRPIKLLKSISQSSAQRFSNESSSSNPEFVERQTSRISSDSHSKLQVYRGRSHTTLHDTLAMAGDAIADAVAPVRKKSIGGEAEGDQLRRMSIGDAADAPPNHLPRRRMSGGGEAAESSPVLSRQRYVRLLRCGFYV